MGKGASLGKEAVSADSGWAGEVARQGRVGEKGDFFSILRGNPRQLCPDTSPSPLFRRGHSPLYLVIVEIIEYDTLKLSRADRRSSAENH